MKFKVTVVDPYAEAPEGEAFATHDYYFLRNLNTEKMFRDETGAELQAQLSTLYSIMAAVEENPTDKEAVKARMDINFSDTRHECLKYMYAELKDGRLVQSEATRTAFEKLENLDEQQALNQFFRCV